MKTVYALFVGINDYPNPIPPLKGCVADVERFSNYLSQLKSIRLKATFLTDEKATKANIVEAFQNHLAQATQDDVALFYYSGHGAQEAADEVFWEAEANKKLQGLVCFDSFVDPDKDEYNFLSDKELRYLIHQLSANQSHILTIFDCCHSGDNTRSDNTTTRKRQISIDSKDLSRPFPVRKWENFIFSDQIKREDFSEKTLAQVLPQGKHIQFGACLPSQSAYESNGKGIFTDQFIQLLNETNNYISYQELKSKLPLRIPKTFKQTPLVHIPHQYNSLFLGFEITEAPEEFAYVTFTDNQWWMDIGKLHGLHAFGQTDSPNTKQIKVSNADQSKQYDATIVKVFDEKTQLEFEQPPQEEGLRVLFDAIPKEEVTIMIKNYANNHSLQKAIEAKLLEDGNNYHLTTEQAEADLIIHIGAEKIKITFNENESYYLVPLVTIYDKAENDVLPYVHHISDWIRIKNLKNPRPSRIKEKNIEVEFLTEGKFGAEDKIEGKDKTFVSSFEEVEQGKHQRKIKIKITNHLPFKVYVSMMYLNMNFMVYNRTLKPTVLELEPNGVAYSFEGKFINLNLEEEVKAFKLSHSTSYFKLLTSTKPFQTDKLEQKALPKPTQGKTRVIVNRKPKSSKSWSNWREDLYTLKIKNPFL